MQETRPRAAVAFGARVSRWRAGRIGAVLTLFVATILGTATPALAGTGAPLADAQPWHYWIAPVLFLSALGVVFIALPVGYYMKVWRLKHPRR